MMTLMTFVTFITHGNVTFDILDWVLQKFEEPCGIY